MTVPFECWWDSAPELMPSCPGATPGARGRFSGVTTNPMLMLDACRRDPPTGFAGSGWELYLACCARSAAYLAARDLRIPFCVQLDPRAAFDAPAMLAQAGEVRDRVPAATIKVPLTSVGFRTIAALAAAGIPVNGTWGFTVAQLVTAARTIAANSGAAPPRHVLTLMEGRIGDLGLRAQVNGADRLARAAECLIFDAACAALLPYRDVVTLLASSLRSGPDDECWHYGTKFGRDVIVTLPPSFLRTQGLPAVDGKYGRPDAASCAAMTADPLVRRYATADGFTLAELDTLPPLVSTRAEAVAAMTEFESLAGRG